MENEILECKIEKTFQNVLDKLGIITVNDREIEVGKMIFLAGIDFGLDMIKDILPNQEETL